MTYSHIKCQIYTHSSEKLRNYFILFVCCSFLSIILKEDWKHIERCIFNYAETTRSDSDYYVGNTVRELCLTRSADFILDTAELNLLIHHLCTS